MNSLNRRDFISRIGLTTAGVLLLQSGSATAALGQSGKHGTKSASPGEIADSFASPPFDCGPWVYWFWMGGNITREGITADLEAMRRVGIAGALIMDVSTDPGGSYAMGVPPGPVKFGTVEWREMFEFACSEAARLGLHINMTNDAGWEGSGGPWVTPERSMQRVVFTTAQLHGGTTIDMLLPQPKPIVRHNPPFPTVLDTGVQLKAVLNYYADIAVLAFPTPQADMAGHGYRIPDIQAKAEYVVQDNMPTRITYPQLAPGQAIPQTDLVDVSRFMDSYGRLKWEAPADDWTIIRFGHTSTGRDNHPASLGGIGLEIDKLSRKATELQFNSLILRLIRDVGPLAGKSFVRTHIDSWENGSQNWTPEFPQEFKRLRGYDITPYLPVVVGRVVENLEVSNRFLWDFRRTISDLLVENYAACMRNLANKHGLGLSIEGYAGVPADELRYGGQANEPMSELWSWPRWNAWTIVAEMTSAGHVYGRNIIGQETFTAGPSEKWQAYPAVVKDIGDWAFGEGVNRFVFHRFAMQPWTNPHYAPGMSMDSTGMHYERTETWWHLTKPWHDYVTRCSYLLRQGHFVADVCYMQSEGAPQEFATLDNGPGNPPRRPGYNYDFCPAEVVLKDMEYKNGMLVLPGGMKYRVLVLPDSPTMTPKLLRKLKTLVDAGATIIGPRPQKSPSLTNFPHCDTEVETLAEELWSTGKIITGKTAAQVLAVQGIKPDFQCDQPMVRWAHRHTADMDIYFVANGEVADKLPFAGKSMLANCEFRATGIQPELWDTETGKISPIPAYESSGGITRIPIIFESKVSVFVVFRHDKKRRSTPVIVSLSHDGKTILSAQPRLIPPKPLDIKILNASYGVPYSRKDRAIVQGLVNEGHFDFPVVKIAAIGGDPDPGVVKTLDIHYTVDGHKEHIVAHDGQNVRFKHVAGSHIKITSVTYGVPATIKRVTKDVTQIVQKLVDTGTTHFPVVQIAAIGGDPDPNVVKTLDIHCVVDGHKSHIELQDGSWVSFADLGPAFHPVVSLEAQDNGKLKIIATQPGRYDCVFASGKHSIINVSDIPKPVAITGPWSVKFPEGWGAPAEIKLDKLIAWNKHSDAGVRYFSGTAAYQTEFEIPAELVAPQRRIYLDLGKVAVMARVQLNDQDMGILWKPPFKLDVTSVLKPGRNSLNIQVTNLWINRMIGDQQLPEDCDRGPGGNLLRWPQWLLDGKPSPTGRFTFTTWQHWHKNDPLAESGLIGPVRMQIALCKDI
ncbi:MAG: glycosyl hydrolase [Planctomycetia bacterium]|nr:glycosyl hydrolase [Planctomycetia bacterium]